MSDGPEDRLGFALRRARESRGVSLRAMARTLRRSHSTLVEYERGHRLAPLTHEAARRHLHPTTWQLADALWSFLYFRSSWADWQGTHELGLTAAREAGNRQAEAWVMTSLDHLYSELQQFDKAVWLRQKPLPSSGRLATRG
jgi:transcriptional regulator with XRE-family HTH domain